MPCRWPGRWPRGGLPVIEITLRTRRRAGCIRRVAGEVEEAVVGAGTILNASQFDEAAKAGSTLHRQPRPDQDLVQAAPPATCRCCPARSRPARSWRRARPGSIS